MVASKTDRDELLDPGGPRPGGDPFEQHARDAPPPPLIAHRNRDLGPPRLDADVASDSDRRSVTGDRRDRLAVDVVHTRQLGQHAAIEPVERPEEARVAGLDAQPREPARDRSFITRGQRPDHHARTVSQKHRLDVRGRAGTADTIGDRRELSLKTRQRQLALSQQRKRTPHRTDEHPYTPRMSARGTADRRPARASTAKRVPKSGIHR